MYAVGGRCATGPPRPAARPGGPAPAGWRSRRCGRGAPPSPASAPARARPTGPLRSRRGADQALVQRVGARESGRVQHAPGQRRPHLGAGEGAFHRQARHVQRVEREHVVVHQAVVPGREGAVVAEVLAGHRHGRRTSRCSRSGPGARRAAWPARPCHAR